MITFIVNGIGIVLIVSIIWWFWLYHPKALDQAQQTIIDIIVEGGAYSPNIIKISLGQTARLRFTRKDPTPCAEQVVFAELDHSEHLALNSPVLIELIPNKPGEYHFTCQMGMYRGKLIVE